MSTEPKPAGKTVVELVFENILLIVIIMVVFAVALFVRSYREMPPALPLLKLQPDFVSTSQQLPAETPEALNVRKPMLGIGG